MPDAGVVVAAQAGDQQARERLVRSYLPLIYNVIGRASDGGQDVDDAVRQAMLQALDGLSELDKPEHFRSWLLAAAVRQIRAEGWSQPLAAGELEPQTDFSDLTIGQLALSGQRRDAVEATRWLVEEREVLALWWLEVAGKVTRDELAEACGLPPAQAVARVRQVEERLEAGRSVVRALAAAPRCAELTTLVLNWDGRPSERSGKRLARHVQDCPQCLVSTVDLIPADRLLRGFMLVSPPPGLVDRLLVPEPPPASTELATRPATALAGGWSGAGRLRRLATTPVLAMAVAVAVLLTTAVVYSLFRPERPEPPAAVRILSGASSVRAASSASASPTPAPVAPTKTAATPTVAPKPAPSPRRTVAVRRSVAARAAAAPFLARHALRSATYPNRYVREIGELSFLDVVAATSPVGTKRDATFTIVRGLANSDCYSFVDSHGRYLRHRNFRVRLDFNDGSTLFKQDVTFCVRIGTVSGSFFLQSFNYPDRYVRYRANFELWLDPVEYTNAFESSAAFTAVAPWV